MSAFLALHNGAVELRQNRQTMIFHSHIDVKMEQSNQPLFKVVFNQEKISCIRNFNVYWQCGIT